jgi:hypothetical protein
MLSKAADPSLILLVCSRPSSLLLVPRNGAEWTTLDGCRVLTAVCRLPEPVEQLLGAGGNAVLLCSAELLQTTRDAEVRRGCMDLLGLLVESGKQFVTTPQATASCREAIVLLWLCRRWFLYPVCANHCCAFRYQEKGASDVHDMGRILPHWHCKGTQHAPEHPKLCLRAPYLSATPVGHFLALSSGRT